MRFMYNLSFLKIFILCFIIVIGGCELFKSDGVEPIPIEFPLGSIDKDPAWSPDGTTIIYYHAANYSDVTDTSGFYLINPDGTNKRLFLECVPGFVISAPDWSPDGEMIVFHANAQIYKIRANGNDLTQLSFEGGNFFPDWSPDGSKIAYDCTTECPGRGIWIMNDDGTNNKHIIGGRAPDWSPDGEKLVYMGGPGPTNAESQIWVADTNGTNEKQLTFFGVTNRYPAWSPDGSKIAFPSFSEHESGIWVIESNGNNLHRLTNKVSMDPCCWSPDGEYIVYTSAPKGYRIYDTLPGGVVVDSLVYEPDAGRLWIMKSNGTDKRQLTF